MSEATTSGRLPAGGRCTYASTSRRVTVGAKSRSPECTAWIAATRSPGGVVLRRNPLAPARSAPKTYSSWSNIVSMSTLADPGSASRDHLLTTIRQLAVGGARSALGDPGSDGEPTLGPRPGTEVATERAHPLGQTLQSES